MSNHTVKTNDTAAQKHGAAQDCFSLWDGVRISVEYGWLCIRQERGWLLWSAKIADLPWHGLLFEDVLRLAHAEKERDDKDNAGPLPAM